jgi:hypothetical protein
MEGGRDVTNGEILDNVSSGTLRLGRAKSKQNVIDDLQCFRDWSVITTTCDGEKGYAVAFDRNHLVVRDIPYLDADGVRQTGAFVAKLEHLDAERPRSAFERRKDRPGRIVWQHNQRADHATPLC